jgi:AraC-like DNA-binding protein
MSTKRPIRLIGVGRYRFRPGAGFGEHSHATHQLSWASSGAQTVAACGSRWTLVSDEAMWIPGGVVHDVGAAVPTDLVLLYFEPSAARPGWQEATAVTSSPALRALVERLPRSGESEIRLDDPIGVVLGDLVQSVAHRSLHATMPAAEPARRIAEHLRAHPDDDRTLVEWGQLVGASSRTLARAFTKGTGMTFTDWRTRIRLDASLGYLADGLPVTRVAHHVGYASASSFIVAFRRQFGHPPSRHFTTSG